KWTPDGTQIVGASDDGYFQTWGAVTGEVLYAFQWHDGIVNTISWSPDSTRFAIASPTYKIARIWNAVTGQKVAELEGDVFYEGPAFVAWSPTNTMLVTVASVIDGGAMLRFWDTEKDTYQPLPVTAEVSVYDITWDPDGAKL